MLAQTQTPGVCRLIEEVWNKGNLAVADEILAPELIIRGNVLPPSAGIAGYKQLVITFRNALSDLYMSIDDLIVSGDRTVVSWTLSGTHSGTLLTTIGFAPPTDRKIAYSGITTARTVGDKIVEFWIISDNLSLLQQLGIIPAPIGM
jgi:predicted ester cyclase